MSYFWIFVGGIGGAAANMIGGMRGLACYALGAGIIMAQFWWSTREDG